MTSAEPMANTLLMAAPHDAHSAIPETTTQVTLYPHNQPQVNLSPGNQPGLQAPASAPPAQRIFKEGKTLGALQILIGLLHFGLGSILGTTIFLGYEAVSFVIGCAFWGGISFIISGSLSVASEKQPNSPCVVKGGVGMNILSAIFSVLGICAYIVDMCVNSKFIGSDRKITPGKTTSGMLIIFSLLELFIASTCAHFGCQLVSYFIISGSLSVASEEQPNSPCLLKGSLGVNILSAIFSVVGICLFITDLCINPHYVYPSSELVGLQIPSKATSGVLLVFSLLELFIASTCAHFGCQLVSYDTVVYQTVYVSNQMPNPDPVNSPPSYSSDMQHSK